MSKSRKKKSSKKQNTGQALGAFALIISLAAVGIGLTQFFLPPKGPTIYSLSYDDQIVIDTISIVDYFNELELSYSAKSGDSVLIEFSCEIYLNPDGTTDFSIHFDINGSIFPTSRIHVYSSSIIYTSGYMRHYINSSEAGDFDVNIYTFIDDEFAYCWIRYCLVTVTVYWYYLNYEINLIFKNLINQIKLEHLFKLYPFFLEFQHLI